jgi:hypothetical protein
MTNPTQITSLRIPTETITAAKTLLAADSGKTFIISAAAITITLPGVVAAGSGWNARFIIAAAAITITLPGVVAAGSGWNARFIIGAAAATGDTVITEDTSVDTDVLAGSTATAADGAAAEASEGFTTVTFDKTARQKGDQVTIVGDKISFYVTGITASATAVVFA